VLAKGKPAPEFAAVDDGGTARTLTDYRGKNLVIWFFPKADTPG
jgi:thioredoxin-dependent peroxiredoxin